MYEQIALNGVVLSEMGVSDGSPTYSPHRMRTTAFAGLVGAAPIPSLVFFDYTDALTEDALMRGVGRSAIINFCCLSLPFTAVPLCVHCRPSA